MFLDYLNTKKIPKYIDPRIKNRVKNRLQVNQSTTQSIEEQQVELEQPLNNTYIYKIDDKFTFIDNGRNSRDISIKINNNIKDNIRISGSGSKKISDEDKLCFALMNRYFILIEHENSINLQIHKDDLENLQNIMVNKNTTGKKTLTDLEIEGNKFTNFDNFKKHTEKIITDIMTTISSSNPIISINTFTIEIFNKYIIDKINDKRCKKSIPILNTKYPLYCVTFPFK